MSGPRGLERSNRAAYTEFCRWPECREPRYDESDAPPLCINHLIECAHYMAERMRISLIDPNREARRVLAEERALVDHAEHGSVVYYVRIGDHVKIGTTVDLAKRLRTMYLLPEALLGWEPGGRNLETQRHVQFAAERIYPNRELFNPSPRLLAYIDTLEKCTA